PLASRRRRRARAAHATSAGRGAPRRAGRRRRRSRPRGRRSGSAVGRCAVARRAAPPGARRPPRRSATTYSPHSIGTAPTRTDGVLALVGGERPGDNDGQRLDLVTAERPARTFLRTSRPARGPVLRVASTCGLTGSCLIGEPQTD